MTQPLALLIYERIMPGSALLNRMEDLRYRVKAIHDPAQAVTAAIEEKPIIVLADMVSKDSSVASALIALRHTPETRHLPIIAYHPASDSALEKEARVAGATLVANDQAIMVHLQPLLQQALEVE